MIKLALFLLIYHIFRVFAWLRYLVYLGVLSNMLFYASGTIVFIVLCTPRDGLDYRSMWMVSTLPNLSWMLCPFGSILREQAVRLYASQVGH